MTSQEVNERYRVPKEFLKEYERLRLFQTEGKTPGSWKYDDLDLECISLMLTLKQCGMEQGERERYMRLLTQTDGAKEERIRLLTQKRKQVLDEIHFHEKRLDKLDYLRYEVLHENGKGTV